MSSSRLYTAFAHAHRCIEPAELNRCWAKVAADQARGLHAVLLIDYEWGERLLGVASPAGKPPLAAPAALTVLMFAQLEHLTPEQVTQWLREQDAGAELPTPAGALSLDASVDEPQFTQAIAAIHEAIRAGETYQVNYTYRLQGGMHGSPAGLYRRLRARQPVPYAAWIALPAQGIAGQARHVLSLSPELFVRVQGGVATAKPMKGTAPRLHAPESDSETARLLALDEKNRAENLMIVDLLRNDLGRVAQIGGVRVPALFAVEPYQTVYQMTSTIEATLKPGVDMPALLRALFPCGSITGAPKLSTMAHIAQLESTPRGLYCGAIGWVDAPQAHSRYSSLGDLCLSVAIRTLSVSDVGARGERALRLGIGAGITLASRAADEYAECQLKARFLTQLDPGLGLIETMRAQWCVDGACWQATRSDEHAARMAASAHALGLKFEPAQWRGLLDQRLAQWPAPGGGDSHVACARAVLSAQGLTMAITPLRVAPPEPVGLVWADAALATTPLSAHKTTARAHYDAAIEEATRQGAFDALFLGSEGQLVEGARSNVLLRVDGQWLTPTLNDGALPGIERARLLREGLLWEGSMHTVHAQRITADHIAGADAWAVCNALRGVLRASAPLMAGKG